MQQKKGFTLIELLIVIAIIGILSSIAVVSVGNVRRLARDSKRLADMRQLQTGLEMYFNENNAYPLGSAIDTATTLGSDVNYVALCNTNAGFSTIALCGNNTMYLAKVAANPVPGGANYSYTSANGDLGNANRPRTFTVTFSLESAIAGYAAGAHELSQLGMR
ncbi:type II secretion system protein [Candidatus Uhrbacteria bacterium]|nr:type II secretion system protein [Candidatus Uhrbacteria bacterium]